MSNVSKEPIYCPKCSTLRRVVVDLLGNRTEKRAATEEEGQVAKMRGLSKICKECLIKRKRESRSRGTRRN